MSPSPQLVWQPSLFASGDEASFDDRFEGVRRIRLDGTSWVEHQPGWVSGSDRLFERLLADMGWEQRSRHMYEQRVVEPRLTAQWNVRMDTPLAPPVLEAMRETLSARYGRHFDSVGFNLYRDGRDSVAWHADRIARQVADPVVALVALGEPRRFLLRPKGGGASKVFLLGQGDLLVTGGRTQRSWEHSVPKVKQAGPRISVAFRHDMDRAAYVGKRVEPPAGPEIELDPEDATDG
jgi:alkylated DNA repair dioxygenase AlkB